MKFPPIKPGDLPWIALIVAVCFLIGSILIFCGLTFHTAISIGIGEGRASGVRYQQKLFDCLDNVRSGMPEPVSKHTHDALSKEACTEIRRVAQEVVQAAVDRYHPKGVVEENTP